MLSPTDLLHCKCREVLGVHLKCGDVTGAALAHVPTLRYLRRILLVEHRIEDRLLRQSQRKLLPTASRDQIQLSGPHRPIESSRCSLGHGADSTQFRQHRPSGNSWSCGAAATRCSGPLTPTDEIARGMRQSNDCRRAQPERGQPHTIAYTNAATPSSKPMTTRTLTRAAAAKNSAM